MKKFRITGGHGTTFEKGDIFLVDSYNRVLYKNGEEWTRGTRSSLKEVLEEVGVYYTFEEVAMNKDDLRTGMVVETRDGWRGIVLGKRIVSEKNHMSLSSLKSDLTCSGLENFDVMKIYKEPLQLKCFKDLGEKEFELIWEREEKSPVQLEIEKLEAEKKEFDEKFDRRMEELKKSV